MVLRPPVDSAGAEPEDIVEARCQRRQQRSCAVRFADLDAFGQHVDAGARLAFEVNVHPAARCSRDYLPWDLTEELYLIEPGHAVLVALDIQVQHYQLTWLRRYPDIIVRPLLPPGLYRRHVICGLGAPLNPWLILGPRTYREHRPPTAGIVLGYVGPTSFLFRHIVSPFKLCAYRTTRIARG